jgi:type II secretory pathway pseudopilin PulG
VLFVVNKKNIQSAIYNLQSKAFTIVELLVAMMLLVILLALSGLVFNTTVEAHRTAGATIDVTRNLRAITDQLNADFRGLRKDAPVFIRFYSQMDVSLPGDIGSRYDAIHFFADGDFQTMRQYPVTWDSSGDGILNGADTTRMETIYGTVARVYYGHANTPAGTDFAASELLARKSHILTSLGGALFYYDQIPLVSNWPPLPKEFPPSVPLAYNYDLFDDPLGGFGIRMGTTYPVENEYEFNTITLTDWINALNYLNLGGVPVNANHFINYCMLDGFRPVVELGDVNTLHLLLSQGIIEMKIQWAYTNDDLIDPSTGSPPVPGITGFTGIRWWPSRDPNGDGDVTDADFLAPGMDRLEFGVYFQLPGGSGMVGWFPVQACRTINMNFSNTFYPRALKFTFVLRDSNGLFADGRTFTHIVYLDN